MQQSLDQSRLEVATNYTPEELFNFLLQSATPANFRRFQSMHLEDYFFKKVEGWESDLRPQSKQENDNDELSI